MNIKKFKQQLDFMGTYDNVLDDIKKYNRADTVNMSEQEMNTFRHIAGPAVMTSNYYPAILTKFFGYGKEFKDLKQGRGLTDTLYDLRNNKIGINIGKQFPNTNNKVLYDYVFKNHIEPNRQSAFAQKMLEGTCGGLRKAKDIKTYKY